MSADVGSAKASAAAAQLRRRARDLEIDARVLDLDADNLGALLDERPGESVVLECSDSPPLKFMVNDGCTAREIPAVIGGAQRWRGQALAVRRGSGACYRCIFEAPPPAGLAEPCSAVGVMGTAVGFFGHLMALHAWRLAQGEIEIAGSLLAVDLMSLRVHTLRPHPRPACPACAGAGIDPGLDLSSACPAPSP